MNNVKTYGIKGKEALTGDWEELNKEKYYISSNKWHTSNNYGPLISATHLDIHTGISTTL